MRLASSAVLVLLLAGCAGAQRQPAAPRAEAAPEPSPVVIVPAPVIVSQRLASSIPDRRCQTGDRMPVARPNSDAAALRSTLPPGLSTELRSAPMPNACPVIAPLAQKRVQTGVRPQKVAPQP
jgi:hypothetical protein